MNMMEREKKIFLMYHPVHFVHLNLKKIKTGQYLQFILNYAPSRN